ncbi:DUF72 domain-containing protein [Paenisporosarcina cavernae]|uniref:DUF72 domain-containing protein n=1 Tax=Paenisporosarcina cavernae TaxID=2320858 RepID=A0A385YT35_9BACL|nr:DUF72 domain-containing protein [Paenisporosarcina cavernae]AYC29979.1 DUF72 domain-containing protein [Paenisporosarcina cavernae]
MIHVGLTGWSDHPEVYSPSSKQNKLQDYSGNFPVVEVDTSFYAIPPKRNTYKWIEETPESFQFVVKAYQGITGHHRGELPFANEEEMFHLFEESMMPFLEVGKLAMILLQFPPWFDCKKENVDRIRFLLERFEKFPVAIEFRHQSWYYPEYETKTLQFLEELGAIHSVCDEPQAGEGSIPLVPIATSTEHVLVRLHGRNLHGWRNPGNEHNWREVRYLYDYNKEELQEISEMLQLLQKQAERVTVLFNNNSGGHAANNAKQLMKLMNIHYNNLAPKQLNLFEGDFF